MSRGTDRKSGSYSIRYCWPWGAKPTPQGWDCNGTITVNDHLQSRFPNIYACGDVAGPYQFTHTASHQAWYASVNALFGFAKKFKVDYRVIPWCTFTDPEVARVGLNEQEANEQGIDYEVTRYGIDDLDRAIAEKRTDLELLHGMEDKAGFFLRIGCHGQSLFSVSGAGPGLRSSSAAVRIIVLMPAAKPRKMNRIIRSGVVPSR